MQTYPKTTIDSISSHVTVTKNTINASLRDMYDMALEGDPQTTARMAQALEGYVNDSLETLYDIVADNNLTMPPEVWTRIQVLRIGLNEAIRENILLAMDVKIGLYIRERDDARLGN
jgi:hypothetical protein